MSIWTKRVCIPFRTTVFSYADFQNVAVINIPKNYSKHMRLMDSYKIVIL